MNEPTQGEFQPVSAMLQMPQLAPPVDRTAAVPAGADGDTPGVEANSLFDLIPQVVSLFS
ncbi:hypothetical protein ACFW9O_34940 [Streptomyces sp. NPDC059499]|uniref:hypothetical protein n=1 Tax=Streptomyces sp. NPDC059499 TaxID=3346852 RepID=UPI0036A3140D